VADSLEQRCWLRPATKLGLWLDDAIRKTVFGYGSVQSKDVVLDIGIGRGGLFPLCNHAGAYYRGLESSESIIKQAQERYYGIYVSQGIAPPIPDELDQNDVIFLMNVLEHMPPTTAYDLCCACRERLRTGGRVVVAVPDCNNLGRIGFNLTAWQHQFWTTLPNVREMMLDAGFETATARFLWLGVTSHWPAVILSGACSLLPFRRLRVWLPNSRIVEKGHKLQDTLSRIIVLVGVK
jgi:hypothetical protein